MSRETQQISIPEPTPDPDALWKTAKALKEAVEILQGIRGNRAAVTQTEFDAAMAHLENRMDAGGI